MSDTIDQQLDLCLRNFVRTELNKEPKSAKELKKAIKVRLKEAWWQLLDRDEIEITRDNKLKLV